MLQLIFVCMLIPVIVSSEDDICVNSMNGEKGRCVPLKDCSSAKIDIKFNIHPQICSFNKTSKEPIICCLEHETPRAQSLLKSLNTDGCPALQSVNKDPGELKHGHKSWQKCLDYQKFIMGCHVVAGGQRSCYIDHLRSQLIFGGGGIDAVKREFPHMEYVMGCGPFSDVWASCYILSRRCAFCAAGGGIDAARGEFPHMALLGFGKNFNEADFNCGGSLISEKYVLTAAHCTSAKELGNVSFAVFGVLKRNDKPLEENIYRVKNIIKHPMYKAPSKYHDIALLEMDQQVQFNQEVKPACLHVGNHVEDKRVYATGWGSLGYRQPNANVLQNVPLWKVSNEACKRKFPKHRHFANGYDNVTQLCYGDDGIPRDTCSGDSGGPLQIRSNDIYCMYLILGVTSFGNVNCAQVGYPGVYTRVAHYIPWIESIVWP